MDDNKSRDIFYGVVAIATLIVALVGATLAYFSISANSENGAVNAKAAVVSIEYNDSQQVTAQADKLIPSSLDVVKQVYEANISNFGSEGALRSNVCLDDNEQQVCSIYRFTVRSDVERDFTATLNNEGNGFTYLAYAVRDVNANSWLDLDTAEGRQESISLNKCGTDTEENTDACYTVEEGAKRYSTATPNAVNSIFGYNGANLVSKSIASTAQVYDLVIFLKENNENQNIDQGKEYTGTIFVQTTESGNNGKITGCVGDDC